MVAHQKDPLRPLTRDDRLDLVVRQGYFEQLKCRL